MALISTSRTRSLTPRQELLWVSAKLESDSPVNNIIMTFSIQGHIELDRFQQAFSSMLKNTAVITATFKESNNKIYQQFNKDFNYNLELIDFSHSQTPLKSMNDYIAKSSIKPFDLTECCFESILFKISEDNYVWYFCQHHIVTDGWSTQIIYELVRNAYENPEKHIENQGQSYLDYLDYRKKFETSKLYEKSKRYWIEKLKDSVEPLSLYGQQSKLSVSTSRIELNLGKERSSQLKALSSQVCDLNLNLGMSIIFSTLLYALLHLISGNKRIGLGLPIHNRVPKFKQTAGLMMEICPLLIDFEDEDSFNSLIDKVRKETFDSISNSQYCAPNPSNSKVYNVSLNFLNHKHHDFSNFETTATYETASNRIAKETIGQEQLTGADSLTFIVNDFSDDDNYILYFDFNSSVFNTETQQRCSKHFLKLLDAFIKNRDTKLNHVNLLSEEESQRLLLTYNETQVSTPKISIVELLEQHADNLAHKTAVHFENYSLSYLQLNQKVNQFSHHLCNMGVGPEVSVGVLMERSIDLLIALLAIMKTGGCYIPLDPNHPIERINMILEDTKSKLLLVDQDGEYSNINDSETQLVIFDRSWANDTSSSNLNLDLSAHRLAYTIFTSGSTGRPKGVEISHFALNNFLHSMSKQPGLNLNDRLLSVTTVSFDIAALELYLPILVGAEVDIASHECTLDPTQLEQRLQLATVIQATPATFRMLINNNWEGNPKLTTFCGGEAFPSDLVVPLLSRTKSTWNMYGPTETTIWSLVEKVTSDDVVLIGRPIDNTMVYILNSAMNPVPEGCIGELYIAGDGLAKGYFQQQDLTDISFINNPFHEGTKMYKTGDLARYADQGKVECLGRIDFQVKLRGFRIELGEIETHLSQLESVNQCVTAIKGENENKVLLGYVVLDKNEVIDTKITPQSLRESLRNKLPAYMVPSAIVILEELPLTPNGKIDRKQLPSSAIEDFSSSDDFVEASTDTEKTIADLWKEELGINKVGLTDSFFDLGGHSLLAVNIINEINQQCDSTLALSSIFKTPYIKDLARLVDSDCGGETDTAAILIKKGSDSTPIFCICGIDLYQHLADQINTNNPVYGVFLQKETEMWMNSSVDSLPTVEELASLYIKVIKEVQAEGPYMLTGISFGGILAYEIAQQLKSNGDSTKMLALLDSVLPAAVVRKRSILIKYHLKQIQQRGLPYITQQLAEKLIKIPMFGSYYRKKYLKDESSNKVQDNNIVIRRDSYSRATEMYSKGIQPYTGQVIFFSATQRGLDLPGTIVDKAGGWRNLIKNLQLYSVNSRHLGIIQPPHVEVIGQTITDSINK